MQKEKIVLIISILYLTLQTLRTLQMLIFSNFPLINIFNNIQNIDYQEKNKIPILKKHKKHNNISTPPQKKSLYSKKSQDIFGLYSKKVWIFLDFSLKWLQLHLTKKSVLTISENGFSVYITLFILLVDRRMDFWMKLKWLCPL